MDDQSPCLYTMYSLLQSICWNPEATIALQTMQIEQAMQFQTDMINQSINSITPSYNPVDSSMCQYIPPKRESWIERLDRLIFPADPIRDWVESEIERISKKYAWIDEV